MLSKTAEYALRAVTCMGAQSERAVSADDLALQTKVPRRYLTRVLQGMLLFFVLACDLLILYRVRIAFARALPRG